MLALLTLAIVTTTGLFFAAGGYAVVAIRRTVELLTANGYATYLGLNDPAPVALASACLRDAVCRPNFTAGWRHYYPMWLPFALLGSLFLMLVIYGVYRRLRHPSVDLATGRWSTVRDLRRAGYYENHRDPEQRGYVGLHPTGKMIRVPERIRFSHTLVLGGPGARKSTGYHWQNILSDAEDGWSVIIFDLKYPDPNGGFVSVLPHFRNKGYNVYAFTPYDEVTHRLPIIQEASNERVAREIAEMIISPTEDGNAAFFRNNERRILAGLLMHAADNGLSLTDLHTVTQQGAGGVRDFMNGKDLNTKKPSTLYRAAGRQPLALVQILFDAEPKEQTGFLSGIEGKLQFFADPRLGNATRTGGDPWTHIDLGRIGTEKTLLYVGLPQKNIDSGSGKLLLQLIKRLIDSALSETAYNHQGAVPVPVSFYLDEFPSLGKLPNVESNFATMRSRRVAYHLTIQNISQGKSIYGQDAFKSFFTSNFQTIMLFPSFIKFEDAKYISEILGDTMTTVEGHGNTRGGQFNSASENWRESTRPLVTIDEMQTWPHDEAIVILNGVPHTRVLVPGIWEERVRNHKNPFKATYDSLDHKIDAQVYISRLIHQSRDAYQRAQLTALRQKASAELKALADEQHPDYALAPGVEAPEPKRPVDPDDDTAAPATPPDATPTSTPTASATAPSAPAEPSAATSASAEPGTPVDSKRVLTKLVQTISNARANVRVVGDRAHGHVRALHIPISLLREHVDAATIARLSDAKVLMVGPDHVQVQPHALKELDEQWYRYLVNQLPVGQGRVSHEAGTAAREAVDAAVNEILDDDLQVTVRVNGRTRAIERVEFSVWGIRTELLHEHQIAWKTTKTLVVKDGVAIVKPAGIAALSEATSERLYALYLLQSGRASAPDGGGTDENATAGGAAPAAPTVVEVEASEPPEEIAAEADDPLGAAPRVGMVPTYTPSARTPPFRAPAAAVPSSPEPTAPAAPAPTKPEPEPEPTPPAKAAPAPAAARVKPAPATPAPAKPAPAKPTPPKPATPTRAATHAQPNGAPKTTPRVPRKSPPATGTTANRASTTDARPATPQPTHPTPAPMPAASPAVEPAPAPAAKGGAFELLELPHRKFTAVRVPAEGDVAERTRTWYRANKPTLVHTLDALAVDRELLTTMQKAHKAAPVGFAEGAALLLGARNAAELKTPKVPANLSTMAHAFAGGGTVPDTVRLRVDDASAEWGVWIARNAPRLRGHPRFDPDGEALRGVEYRVSLLLLPPDAAREVLGEAVDEALRVPTALGPLVALDVDDLPPSTEPALATT